jgi:hypothetical protein
MVMSCRVCSCFPAPLRSINEIAISLKRHGTLFQCRECGAYIETIEEEHGFSFLDLKEAREHYTFDVEDIRKTDTNK